jgi:transposase
MRAAWKRACHIVERGRDEIRIRQAQAATPAASRHAANFEVHGVDARGKAVMRKTLRRDTVPSFFANLPPCLIGMEASNGAHYWARVLSALGHEVRLISPQFVKPYVKSNKNDRNDAEAICEAVGRPHMRFVPVKSAEQLALQAIHRVRSRLVSARTRLVNQVRGLLAEHGFVIARDIAKLRQHLADIIGCSESTLNSLVRTLLIEMQEELTETDRRSRFMTGVFATFIGSVNPASVSARSKVSDR